MIQTKYKFYEPIAPYIIIPYTTQIAVKNNVLHNNKSFSDNTIFPTYLSPDLKISEIKIGLLLVLKIIKLNWLQIWYKFKNIILYRNS